MGSKTESTGIIIGIDLGTTNSCVAVMEGKTPKIITNSGGDNTTPSVVAIKNGETLVGKAAKNQQQMNPQGTISECKRMIGHTFEEVKHIPFTFSVIKGPKGRCLDRA